MASYTRQSSFSDGDTISASLFNNEYNQLVTAFSYSSSGTTGHRHDGTAAEGGNIHTIGDQDFLNKIVVDSSNNRWGVYVQVSGATVEQIRFQDGSIVPVTSNDIDLGTASLQFKDLHIDGTANIDSLTLTSGSTVTVILDEDDLSTNSATALATQQSIKAYVDSQITGQSLSFSGDSGGSLSIDLDSEALTITGGTGIDTTGSTNDMSIAIDSTVATLTGSQTLTNKTLTSPDINGGTIDGATIGGSSAGDITYANLSDGTITITAFADEDDMSSDSATLVPTQQSVKAYVDSKVTAEDLDFQADSGGALSIDLDSETMTFTGGTGIDTSGSGNAVTFAIDSTVTTLAGTQTLTNKTLTTPVITSISNSGTVTLPSGTTTLVGTATSDVLTNKTISGSSNTLSNIGNSSLSNSSVSFGGISVALGSSDATPAFDLSDAIGYTGDSSLVTTGTISSGVWQGTAVADTYVANDLTISGGTVNNTVIGDSSPAAADFTTVDTTGNATIGGNLAVTGNLTINGTTSTVNSTTVTIDDPIFTLGGDTTPSTDDNKDRGIEFKWHNGTEAKLGFFGYDDSASVFTFIPDASNTSEVFSGSAGNVAFGAISGTSFASTGNMTFGDNDKAIFGAGSDLQIYHDGSDSYIVDNGTGDLLIRAENNLFLKRTNSDETYLSGAVNGAVTLFHNNNAKIATTISGIDVTGTLVSDGLTVDNNGSIVFNDPQATDTVLIGTNDNELILRTDDGDITLKTNENKQQLRVSNNGDISFYEDTGTTAKLVWDASAESLGIGTSSPSEKLTIQSGNLNFMGGTNDAQYIKFGDTGDDDIGNIFYYHGNNNMVFTTNASEAMRIDSAGNVDLYQGNNLTWRYAAGSTIRGSISVDSADNITFSNTSSNTERMRITSAGNVGIGTTSPTEELTVGSGGSNYIGIGGDGVNASGIRFYRGASTVDGLIEVDANEDMIISMDNTGALGTGQILFKTGATERMRLDASGNLLVGKTSDAINVAGVVNYNAGIVRASRNGNSGQFGRISTDGDIVTFYKDTVTVGSIGTGSGDLHIDGAASHSGVRFQASSLIPRLNGADADNSIDLGYDDGTDTYRFKDLYLSGNINLGTKITAASVTTTVNAWKSTSNSTSSSKHMLFANPNGNVGDIRTNGSATAYITSSDYRLKENVVAMSGATERLKQLKPSRFNFIADADTTVDGFLAHEVQAVVPEAIAGDKDGMMDEEYEVTPAVLDDDGNVVTEAVMGTRSVPDYQGIDQSKLVPLLVATIQELEARITALES
jgi:hypothetical protein